MTEYRIHVHLPAQINQAWAGSTASFQPVIGQWAERRPLIGWFMFLARETGLLVKVKKTVTLLKSLFLFIC